MNGWKKCRKEIGACSSQLLKFNDCINSGDTYGVPFVPLHLYMKNKLNIFGASISKSSFDFQIDLLFPNGASISKSSFDFEIKLPFHNGKWRFNFKFELRFQNGASILKSSFDFEMEKGASVSKWKRELQFQNRSSISKCRPQRRSVYFSYISVTAQVEHRRNHTVYYLR